MIRQLASKATRRSVVKENEHPREPAVAPELELSGSELRTQAPLRFVLASRRILASLPQRSCLPDSRRRWQRACGCRETPTRRCACRGHFPQRDIGTNRELPFSYPAFIVPFAAESE